MQGHRCDLGYARQFADPHAVVEAASTASGQLVCRGLQALQDAVSDGPGEARRQLTTHSLNHLGRSADDVVDQRIDRLPLFADDAVPAAQCGPVSAQDVADAPVRILGAHGHRHLGAVRRDTGWPVAQHGVDRQHVVQRGELVTPAGTQEQAEFLA